ncbi:MAG TPA: Gfo/Idh/MocA family oxidoreductase, partial [Thermomicrobiales bacterium]|nr:Gfo/Idh/MocA family oxidoreductase [Thermomicrobiales bacterium]
GDLLSAQVTFATSDVSLRNAAYLSGRIIEEVRETGIQLDGGSSGERHWLFDRARSGGGVLHWLGVHWLDLLRMVTGEELDCASATLATRTSLPVDVEDVASVTLRSTSGMIATVTCGYVLPSGADQTRIAIQGTEGWVTWDGASPELVVESRQPAWETDARRGVRFDVESKPGYAGALGWEALERFRSAVQHGAPLPVGIDDAMAVLEMLDAIHREADGSSS